MRTEILEGDRGTRLGVLVPETRWERMRGLLGSAPPEPGTGLLLEGTRSVHTVGLPFPITVVLLDADLRVRAGLELAPNRLLLPRPRVRHVLELGPGAHVPVGERFRRRRA